MPPPAVIGSERDAYANLLRDTRGLSLEQGNEKSVWFASLPLEDKGEVLFELEMLLKGLACFGDPRNSPGQGTAIPTNSQDYHGKLRIVRDAMERVIALSEQLLAHDERAPMLTRYLESVLPEDTFRRREIHEQLAQPSPAAALVGLRHALSQIVDLAEGLLRLGHVPNRLYFAIHGLVVREIAHSHFFSPLTALEFCAEIDRIEDPEIVQMLGSIRSNGGHRIATLTLLSLFRALGYLTIIENYASDPLTTRRAFVMLAVLRSDLRALTRYLVRRGADALADAVEHELFDMSAHDMVSRFPFLTGEIRSLVRIRGALVHIASTLRVDVQKVFEHDLVGPEAELTNADLAAKLHLAATEIRASVHHAIRALCHEISPDQTVFHRHDDPVADRALSVRARREIWMFQQIVRAFVAKADAMASLMTQTSHDRWSEQASFQFVYDFLGHFRAIGHELVQTHDYDRRKPLIASLDRLRNVDLIEARRMQNAIGECRHLLDFLGTLLEKVSNRAELKGIPFDRHGAGATLKIYLSRG
jgi:hypothetical protein